MFWLTIGSLGALALLILFSHLYNRLLILGTNEVAFEQTINGALVEHSTPGIHFLHALSNLRCFNLSWFANGKADVRSFHRVTTAPVRIDPPDWEVVSSERERIFIDLWLTLQIKNARRFLVEACSDDPASVVIDRVRLAFVAHCRGYTTDQLLHGDYTVPDLSAIEAEYGIVMTVQVESVHQSKELETRRAEQIKLAQQKHAEYDADVVRAKRDAQLAEQRMRLEEERQRMEHAKEMRALELRREQEMKRNEMRVARAKAQADVKSMKQAARWNDFKSAKDSGIGAEQYVELKRIEALRGMDSGVSYLPSSLHPMAMLNLARHTEN